MEDYDANKIQPIRIGYYDDEAVYLFPNETWHVLQVYNNREGSHFPFQKSSFFKLLKDRGLIVPDKKGQPTIQKKFNGKNYRVLKFTRGGIFDNFVTSVNDKSTN